MSPRLRRAAWINVTACVLLTTEKTVSDTDTLVHEQHYMQTHRHTDTEVDGKNPQRMLMASPRRGSPWLFFACARCPRVSGTLSVRNGSRPRFLLFSLLFFCAFSGSSCPQLKARRIHKRRHHFDLSNHSLMFLCSWTHVNLYPCFGIDVHAFVFFLFIYSMRTSYFFVVCMLYVQCDTFVFFFHKTFVYLFLVH